jgi:hypothetical protein
MERAAIAFLIAPLAVPILMARGLYSAMSSPDWFMVALVISILTAYAGALLFGLPAYLWLRRRKWTAFWVAPVAGFVVGGLTWCAIVALFGSRGNLSDVDSVLRNVKDLREVLWPFGPLGAVVGSLLWIIGRPDLAD